MAKVTLSYQETRQAFQYEPVVIGIILEKDTGEDIDLAIGELKVLVRKALDKAVAERRK